MRDSRRSGAVLDEPECCVLRQKRHGVALAQITGAYFSVAIKKNLTRGNSWKIYGRGDRKKRRGALKKGLAEKEKMALYVGAAAVACGCRRWLILPNASGISAVPAGSRFRNAGPCPDPVMQDGQYTVNEIWERSTTGGALG